ncbi:MAG: hypothetical protein FJ404_11830 [Verrucomicrobia bacterium]|nr:hypothetical protein [Verrucomicrobiota bacterium]
MFGQTLEGNERREEALASFAEGVRLLTPHFQALPAAHASLMQGLAQEYQRLAQALNQPTDEALLAPVAAIFARLQAPAPAGTTNQSPPST